MELKIQCRCSECNGELYSKVTVSHEDFKEVRVGIEVGMCQDCMDVILQEEKKRSDIRPKIAGKDIRIGELNKEK